MNVLPHTLLGPLGVKPENVEKFATALDQACNRFEICTPNRVAAFLGQCMVETGAFSQVEENLMYTHPERIMAVFPGRVKSMAQAVTLVRNPQGLANCVYAGVNGNGNPISGDGFAYRGRGLFQLSGRGNYADAEDGLNRPYLVRPDLVALPPDACLTAAWYWHNIKANILADASQFDTITRRVNGNAMMEAGLRRAYTEKALKALA